MIEAMCMTQPRGERARPELRERLRPDYRAGVQAARRLAATSTSAIQHPNAELVTEGIERVEPQGVRTRDGRLHELDVLVLATGFHADAFMRPMDVIGRDGVTLDERVGAAADRVPVDLDARTSRTSSCSTARTARSATSR